MEEIKKTLKLTEKNFVDILNNKNEKSVEVYKEINQWGTNRLKNKNKGLIHRGQTTLNLKSKNFKYGYGTNGLIYKYSGSSESGKGRYFLFRVSVDGLFSPSVFWNTLNFSNYDKKPMNDSSFREEFFQRFYNIGINYYEVNPFEKRDVFTYSLDFFKTNEELNEFFSIWEWVIQEIEISIDYNRLYKSLDFQKEQNNEKLNLESRTSSKNLTKRKYSKVESRYQSSVFRNGVLERYSTKGNIKCAFCDISNLRLIEAAHIIPYSNNPTYGFEIINNPKNGLCLCANHHKIYDFNQEDPIVWINPNTLEIESNLDKNTLLHEFKISESSLANLQYLPDKGCLEWRFNQMKNYK